MKENDEDADNISFNIESNVVYNMKESFISEKKKYPLVSKPTNFGGSVESRENVVSLADILTINMKKKQAIILVINVRAQVNETLTGGAR